MGKWRLLFLLFFILISAVMILSAQSNLIIDDLLGEEKATFGKTAYLALAAAGIIPEEATLEDAIYVLEKQEWRIDLKEPEDPITLGEFSFLLMKAFNIQGGLMYSIIPGPRYACRELAYLKIIPGNTSPYRAPSGEEVVRILGRLLEWKEERP